MGQDRVQPARVRMIGAHQLAPRSNAPLHATSGGMPEPQGATAMYRAQPRPKRGKSLSPSSQKSAPHRTQGNASSSVVHAVGHGNWNNPSIQIMQHLGADSAEHLRNARGVILKPATSLPRQIEYPAQHPAGRPGNLETPPKVRLLVSGHLPVGLGHLGPRGGAGGGAITGMVKRPTDLLGRGAARRSKTAGQAPSPAGERCPKLRVICVGPNRP